jgi:hypothetical protein
MMRKISLANYFLKRHLLRSVFFLVLAVMMTHLFPVALARAEGPTHITIRSAYSRQGVENSVGTTKLLRNRLGLTAVFDTTKLPLDQNEEGICSTLQFSLHEGSGGQEKLAGK